MLSNSLYDSKLIRKNEEVHGDMSNEYSHKNPRQLGDPGNVQLTKHLPHQHTNLNLIPTTHEKASCAPCTCNSCKRQEDICGFLVNHLADYISSGFSERPQLK